jgi:hypothetical protein
MINRVARATVLAISLIAVTAGATFAHECYNASRSAQGNAGASHSTNWSTESVAELFTIIHLFGIPGVDTPLSAEQAEVAFEAALEMGVPAEVTIFTRDLIGANGRAFTEGGKAADGKGIDHFFVSHGQAVVNAYFEGLSFGD